MPGSHSPGGVGRAAGQSEGRHGRGGSEVALSEGSGSVSRLAHTQGRSRGVAPGSLRPFPPQCQGRHTCEGRARGVQEDRTCTCRWASPSSVLVRGWSHEMSALGSSSFTENYEDAKLFEERPKFITWGKNPLFFCILLERQGTDRREFCSVGVTELEGFHLPQRGMRGVRLRVCARAQPAGLTHRRHVSPEDRVRVSLPV